MMFPMVLPLPRTSISFGTGAECFLAHTGSASMASGLRVGAFPSKVTVPVMVEAARATPGQNDTATSPAASHNLFPVPRMLGSFVIAITSCRPSSRVGRLLSPNDRQSGRLYTGPVVSCNSTRLRARDCSGARAAGDARKLRRSRTRAIRRASGRGAARAPAVASASSPPPRSTRRRRANAATSSTDGRSPSGWSVGMTCQ